jgi:Mn2+/Fe2+ NRAMP family transporter
LLVVAAVVFLPRHIFPETLSTTVMAGALPFARKALIAALLGTLACIAGAAIETTLSSAYNLCQFFNLPWGKDLPAKSAPAYTAAWVGIFVLALAIALLGIPPLQLVNVSVIFGMVVMPLTYYPILRVAADKNIMGKHVNSRVVTITGVVFLVLITIAALAAIPLMIATHSGRP